jgi:hypothetical protein
VQFTVEEDNMETFSARVIEPLLKCVLRHFTVVAYINTTNEQKLIDAIKLLRVKNTRIKLGIGKANYVLGNHDEYNNLTHIGVNAFRSVTVTPDFTKLTNLTHIGAGAFEKVTGTPDFTKLTNLTHIGNFAFDSVQDRAFKDYILKFNK